MQQDQIRWNEKFSKRPLELAPPELFFVHHQEMFKSGSLLDIAGGDGRNAIYFAKKGFKTTVVDISPVALERIKQFSKLHNVHIETQLLDLDQPKELLSFGEFDNILISHFKPCIELWSTLPLVLKNHGRLFCSIFNLEQHNRTDFNKNYCLRPRELYQVSPKLKCLEYKSFIDQDKCLDGYVFECQK